MDDQQTEEQQKWRSDRHKKTLGKRLKRISLLISVLVILTLIAYTTIIYGGKMIVNEEKLILKGPSTIETVDGDVIWDLYDEYRIPVELEQIPDHVKDAFIAIEDRRFYSHSGVDFRSVMRAIYRDVIARSKVEGASTITQQLSKNLFLTNDKSWLRKTKEVMVALYLERELSKDEILLLYLNAIYFGKGQYGIEAAAQKYFSKSVTDLSLGEGALLAGIVKAPNGYSPTEHPEKALNRRDIVIQAMFDMEMITESEKNEVLQSDMTLDISVKQTDPSIDSFIDLVLREAVNEHDLSIEELRKGGYRLTVTVNPLIQKIAYEEFQHDKYFPGDNAHVEGAFVMMDEQTGGIVAALGGRDYRLTDLNRLNVTRQPGSTIKPIAVYAPALMEGKYGPYSLIPDQLIEWDSMTFRNADHEYDGSVSVYHALIKSKNTPSIWLLDQIGIDYAKSYLEKMNMPIEDEGLSIALGGLKDGITPINLVESYRTFVHNGQFTDSYTINEIYNHENERLFSVKNENSEVFTPQVAWTMTEMLIETVESGTGQAGDYKKQLAGKTGSTEHPHVDGFYKDIWFAGYTPDYVTALWMGYDTSTAENYLTEGSSYPTVLTKKILTEIDNTSPMIAEFTKPDEVEEVAKPIQLPDSIHAKGTVSFGGFSLIRGKITWTTSADERVIYHIYKEKTGIDKRVGEVEGKSEFFIDNISLLKPESYYVVPYDPLTKLEGNQSNRVNISL